MAGRPEELTEEEHKELYSPIEDMNALLPEDIRKSQSREAAFRKLHLLLREHGIGDDIKNRWAYLSYVLASKYHPGFRVRREYGKPTGRPRVWDYRRQQQLLNDIEAIQSELRSKWPLNRARWTIMAACGHAIWRFPDRYRGMTQINLVTRHREAKKALEKVRLEAPDLLDADGNYRDLLSSVFDGLEADVN